MSLRSISQSMKPFPESPFHNVSSQSKTGPAGRSATRESTNRAAFSERGIVGVLLSRELFIFLGCIYVCDYSGIIHGKIVDHLLQRMFHLACCRVSGCLQECFDHLPAGNDRMSVAALELLHPPPPPQMANLQDSDPHPLHR